MTVDLDVQVRDDLLSFLKEDSERRSATILCAPAIDKSYCTNGGLALDATHIFDGLNEFPTHIAHMRLGSFVMSPIPWPISPAEPLLGNRVGVSEPSLFQIALHWLREDREHRHELEKAGRKIRGARRDQVRTLDILGCTANIGIGYSRRCRQVPSHFSRSE